MNGCPRLFVFECLKCGKCCKNLLRETKTGLHGLNLLPSERNLFSQKMISPYMGVGRKKPEQIILFQLTEIVCPHLLDNNQCEIYDKRPLACRAFPIVSVEDRPLITTECSSINESGEITIIAPEETRAKEQLSQYIKGIMEEKARLYAPAHIHAWEYDLSTKKWVQIC